MFAPHYQPEADVLADWRRLGFKWKRCRFCRAWFKFPLQQRPRYCSPACKEKGAERAKERRKAKAAATRQMTCLACGAAFEAKRVSALTCSSACRQKLYRQTQQAPELKEQRRHVGRKERREQERQRWLGDGKTLDQLAKEINELVRK